MAPISVDDRLKFLTNAGCKVLEHTTELTAAESTRTGSDPLDEPIDDGFYRIVQLDMNNQPTDAAYGSTSGVVGQTEFPVLMSSTPQFTSQFWKLTRQYGVKNGYTIVPVVTPGTTTPGLGGTAVDKDGAVNVKRASSYPIWQVKGSEKVTYEQNGKYVSIVLYRIYEVASDRCWRTNAQQAVTVAAASPSSQRPAPAELYQFVVAVPQQTVTISNVETVAVRASNAEVVKRYYFGNAPTAEQLKRMISLQLTTDSHDQGWASQPDRGLWSWFEIAVFSKAPAKNALVKPDDIKKGSDGKPLTWISHRVPLQSSYAEQSGILFTRDHDIWKNVSNGDTIGVLACAQYAAWCLDARSGSLKFEELIVENNY